MCNTLLPPPPWWDTNQLGGYGLHFCKNMLSLIPWFLKVLALLFLNKVFSKNFSWSHVNKVFSRVSFLNNLTSLFSFFMVRQALKGYKKSNNVVDYVRRCWVGFARLQKLFAGQSLKYYFLKLYFL